MDCTKQNVIAILRKRGEKEEDIQAAVKSRSYLIDLGYEDGFAAEDVANDVICRWRYGK